MLITLICTHKTTGEVWVPYKLVILLQKSLFCMQKKHRLGLGPIETSSFGANHTALQTQNDRWCLGLIEICYSGPKVAVLNARNTDKGWDPQRQVILVLITLYYMHKTTGDVWNPYRLFILMLSTLLRVLKTTDEVWNPYRLASLVIKSLFCMKKNTDEGWNPYRLVILVQITLFCIHKTTGDAWDP